MASCLARRNTSPLRRTVADIVVRRQHTLCLAWLASAHDVSSVCLPSLNRSSTQPCTQINRADSWLSSREYVTFFIRHNIKFEWLKWTWTWKTWTAFNIRLMMLNSFFSSIHKLSLKIELNSNLVYVLYIIPTVEWSKFCYYSKHHAPYSLIDHPHHCIV